MAGKYLTPWSWNKGNLSETDTPFDALHRRVNRMFEDVLSGFDLAPIAGITEKLGAFTPRISVKEDAQQMKVTAELPGLELADVDISLTKESLTIRGEKREEKEHQEREGRYYNERTYGGFTRVIPLTVPVDEDKVDASFSKGVLTIVLPKAPDAQKLTRKISVRGT